VRTGGELPRDERRHPATVRGEDLQPPGRRLRQIQMDCGASGRGVRRDRQPHGRRRRHVPVRPRRRVARKHDLDRDALAAGHLDLHLDRQTPRPFGPQEIPAGEDRLPRERAAQAGLAAGIAGPLQAQRDARGVEALGNEDRSLHRARPRLQSGELGRRDRVRRGDAAPQPGVDPLGRVAGLVVAREVVPLVLDRQDRREAVVVERHVVRAEPLPGVQVDGETGIRLRVLPEELHEPGGGDPVVEPFEPEVRPLRLVIADHVEVQDRLDAQTGGRGRGGEVRAPDQSLLLRRDREEVDRARRRKRRQQTRGLEHRDGPRGVVVRPRGGVRGVGRRGVEVSDDDHDPVGLRQAGLDPQDVAEAPPVVGERIEGRLEPQAGERVVHVLRGQDHLRRVGVARPQSGREGVEVAREPPRVDGGDERAPERGRLLERPARPKRPCIRTGRPSRRVPRP